MPSVQWLCVDYWARWALSKSARRSHELSGGGFRPVSCSPPPPGPRWRAPECMLVGEGLGVGVVWCCVGAEDFAEPPPPPPPPPRGGGARAQAPHALPARDQ